MPDIFISYSRKDSVHALKLADQLRAQGIESWIDQKGIEGAERWATEIVEGIKACSTFIVLLSPHSIESEHVLRELSLALEKRKRVLPVDLLPAELPSSFEYPLAGLQRVAISDFDGILRAHKHGVERVFVKDSRKSLMILPLEDLSPASEDNAWFADGLTGELISALSNIKSLRIPDRKTSMDLKGFRGKTSEIARELDVRYFIEGNVRKLGDQIKISLELLDIDTGDYLWQHSYRGAFKDIFDMQEAVAREVVIGLKLHLTPEEQEKVRDRGTENAEAYELFVRADEYFSRQTKDGIQLAIQLLSEAIQLDPKYVVALEFKAFALANLYRSYLRDPALLEEGLRLAKEALRLKPDLWEVYRPLSTIYRLQGNLEQAEAAVLGWVEKAPEKFNSHFALGFLYMETGQFSKAIEPFEQVVKINPEYMIALMNLVICCNGAMEENKQISWAKVAIPRFERHLRLHPDDESASVNHAVLLFYAGRTTDAREAARRFSNLRDGVSLFNAACLQCMLGDYPMGLQTFRTVIESGFRNIPPLKGFLNDENEGIASLRGTPEYEEVARMVEKIEVEGKTNG